ncbi:MAG: isoprenyl transferase [Bacteroidota bacterium]|nr:isoprenyl transferase [Bacteroidota bacterium]
MIEPVNKSIPKHIAIIMDGNGRWAEKKGKLRVFGHRNGIKSVKEIVEGSAELGIKYLTLFAFSTENWKRPKREINALMKLLVNSIKNEKQILMKNDISVKVIGEIDTLPRACIMELRSLIKETENNKKMTLILALSYSSRWEILHAVKNIIHQNIKTDDINEELFSQYLATKNVPDPELIIRTSGEFRVSNFLLWQIAYAELYFTETLWPDFRKSDLKKAVLEYQKRDRRFGKVH